MNKIEITNVKILEFCNKHQHLDIETMCLLLIDLYDKMFEGMTTEYTKHISSEILLNIKNQGKELEYLKCELKNNIESYKSEMVNLRTINNLTTQNLQGDITSIKESLHRLNQDITSTLTSKFYDMRTTYSEDLKQIITNNNNDNILKIIDKIEHENISIIDKTYKIINEIIPKSHNEYYNKYNLHITDFKNDINKQFIEIKEVNSNISLDKINLIITEKYSILLNTLQQNIVSYLSQTENKIKMNIDEIKDERIIKELKDELTIKIDNIKLDIKENKSDISLDKMNILFNDKYSNILSCVQHSLTTNHENIQNNINEIKNLSIYNQQFQEKINTDLNNFISQYSKSSKKGEISEIILNKVLSDLYPSSIILDTTGQTSMGDFILKRSDDKPIILFENKNYETIVPKREIDKFIYDCETNLCSGVLISQQSGIALKKHLEIDINNGNVLVYVHKMGNSNEIISLCVDIIDNISRTLKQLKSNGCEINISKEQLILINEQYHKFIEKRESIILLLNENNKNVINNIKELEISELNIILSSLFASTKIITLKCDICNSYCGTTKRALGQHKTRCKLKNSTKITNTDEQIVSEDSHESNESQNIETLDETPKEKLKKNKIKK